MYEETTIHGVTYCTDGALLVGDYCGSGTVGESNQRIIRTELECEYRDLTHEWEGESESWSMRHWGQWTDPRYGEPAEYRSGEWVPMDPPTSEIVEVYGSYGSRQIWVRRDSSLAEMVDALSSYPVLDESDLSEVELEAESEAWDNWVRADLLRGVSEEIEEIADSMSDAALFECYRDAMGSTNTYPVHEQSGCYVDIDRIRDAFTLNIRDAYERA